MRSLVFGPIQVWPSHFSEVIELLNRCVEKDEETFFVICSGSLNSCAGNAFHDTNTCKKCVQISNYSIQNLIPKKVKIINLEIDTTYNIKPRFVSFKAFAGQIYEELPFGRLVCSQLCDDLASYNLTNLSKCQKDKAEELALNCIQIYNSFKKYILNYNISNVFSWNGRRPSDGPPLYAAKKLNRNYFSFISGGKPGKIFIAKSLFVQDIDNIKNNIDKLKKEQKKVYILKQGKAYLKQYTEGKLNQVGYFQYAGKQKTLLEKNQKKTILVATSSPQELIHDQRFFEFFGQKPFEKMLQFFSQQNITKKFNVIFRWHPRHGHSKNGDEKRILRLAKKTPFIQHIFPSSDISTENLLNQVDIVATFGSTIGYQAVCLGKPLIVCGPMAKIHGNSCYAANSPSELINILKSRLQKKSKIDALAAACYFKNFGEKMRFIKTKKVNNSLHWFFNSKTQLLAIHPEQQETKSKFPFLVRIKTFFKKLTSRKILN